MISVQIPNIRCVFSLFFVFSVALFNVGCDGECTTEAEFEVNPACEDPERGHITGQITIPGATQNLFSGGELPEWLLEASLLVAEGFEGVVESMPPEKRGKAHIPQLNSNRGHQLSREENWRASEFIIRAHTPMSERREEIEHYVEGLLGEQFYTTIQMCNAIDACLFTVSDRTGKPVGKEETRWLIERLSQSDEFQYVEPNLILQTARLPNDDFYGLQWHYSAINMEGAWEISVGSDDIIAAVVDTGVKLAHPDLANRLVGSVDLISDVTTAQDGDGRDEDGDDVGDNACGLGCHSYHGTHVAGTMGAESDNALMVSGMSWAGGLLAVRVLGQGGGSLFDIADGIFWSVGEEVEGVGRNENPADVVNLSLGGQGESQFMNETVTAAIATGAIIIAAAGNSNADASSFTPANAPGIITVAAVGNVGGEQELPIRAPYSNFGDVVDIAAPGGDQSVDLDGDGQADGVLSTLDDFVAFYQGTSMAAPHVAGLAMLMKAQNPDVEQAEALQLMQDNSNDQMTCAEGCGRGMIDAAKTLLAVDGRDDEPMVVASPSMLRVGKGDLDAKLKFENVGGAPVTVDISVGGPDREKITVDQTDGRLDPGATLELNVDIDRTGEDEGEAILTAAWGEGNISEARIVWNAEQLIVADYAVVGAVWFDMENDEIYPERLVGAYRQDEYVYKLFNLTPGEHVVIGLSDDDNDGEWEANEGVGVYPSRQEPEFVTTVAGETVTDINFNLTAAFALEEDNGSGAGEVGAACESGADCAADLYCEPLLPGGYCTSDCSTGDFICPDGSVCFALCADEECLDTYAVCFDECATNEDCRAGYYCDLDNTCFPEG